MSLGIGHLLCQGGWSIFSGNRKFLLAHPKFCIIAPGTFLTNFFVGPHQILQPPDIVNGHSPISRRAVVRDGTKKLKKTLENGFFVCFSAKMQEGVAPSGEEEGGLFGRGRLSRREPEFHFFDIRLNPPFLKISPIWSLFPPKKDPLPENLHKSDFHCMELPLSPRGVVRQGNHIFSWVWPGKRVEKVFCYYLIGF